jgi:hypothetical protein
MKNSLLLWLLLAVAQSGFSQTVGATKDSTVVIPTHELKLKTAEGRMNLSTASYILSTIVNGDSVYVYQSDRNNAFVVFNHEGNYTYADLRVSLQFNADNLNFQYRFNLDSLGTDKLYLVLQWFGSSYQQRSTPSGSGEFSCTEIIRKYQSYEEGLTIISLDSKQVLFEGITNIRNKESETRNPGGSRKAIKDEHIVKVRFAPRDAFLNLFNHGYEDYNYWLRYANLPYGFYQLINDQYVLVSRR